MISVLSLQHLRLDTLDLFQQYRQSGSRELRNQIIELNLGLAKKEARRWSNQCSETYDDLLQVGCLGLLRAIDSFDQKKGYAFSCFALPYIRGEIQHYLRDKSYCVRMPRRWLELWQQAKTVKQDFCKRCNRQPTEAEIAEILKISRKEWQDITLAWQNQEPLSLDLPLGDKHEAYNSLGDTVPDPRYRSFQLAEEDRILLRQGLAQLEQKTREIIESVFLKDLTQKETAQQLGISIVTISRHVKKGLKQLEQFMLQAAG